MRASCSYPHSFEPAYHYLHRDYLGSILAITNAEGVIQEERQFGAWGTVDTFLDSSGNTSFGHTSLLGRGYTGHEHFFDVGLIHMNGRMYDANLGRFLSPDNYIQDPYNTQNYNRYAYVLNNPLMFNDPSGEFIHLIVGAVIGGAINLVANWNNIDNFAEGLAAFGAGAAQGALTAAFGPAGAIAGGAITGATNNIIAQTGNGVGLGDVNWGQVGLGAGIGAAAGIAGYGAGQWAGNNLGGVAIRGLNVSANSAIGGAVTGAIGGAVGGYAGGFTGGLLMTGDLSEAHQVGISGLKMGAGIGAGTGAVGGYMSAKNAGLDPWTGTDLGGKSSKILNTTPKQLQKKFKHAGDFGVEGNFNKANSTKFNSAINQHINSSGIKTIQGTYHKQPAIHYLNLQTGLNVISHPSGQFWSGWQLSPGQLQNVIQHGGL